MSLALQPNALTQLATVKTELGLTDSSLDDVVARLINGASDSIEQYCDRKFARDANRVDMVAGYGSEILHVPLTPVESITSVSINDDDTDPSDYYLRDADTGAIFRALGWLWTAGIDLSAQPHRRAGFEERAYAVAYVGGYCLPKDNRLPADAAAWQASHDYSAAPVGTLVLNTTGAPGTHVYKLKTPGTSTSGSGPSGIGTGLQDGTAVWDYARESYPLPTELEEACIQLAVYRFRLRGRDLAIQSETIGKTQRVVGHGMPRPSIPIAISDVLDGYKRFR